MQHAIGKVPDSRHDLMVTLNQAGRMLVSCHPFSWRTRVALLPAVADQSYIELPEDFGEVEEATVPDVGSFTRLNVVDLATIYRMRQNTNGSTSGAMWASFEGWSGQKSGEDYPSPRVELYPTPSTDAAPTITLVHRRIWKRIRPFDTRAQVDIPANAERALVQIARMLAVAIENNTEHNLPDVADIPEVKRLIREDGMRQTDQGPMRGGAGRYRTSFQDIAPSTINVS